jgi:hypothetical protein
MPSFPKKWTHEQLAADITTAVENFRRERLDEPLGLYGKYYDEARIAANQVMADLRAVLGPERNYEKLATIVSDVNQLRVFRYTAAPPISNDDLKILADTKLSKKQMLGDLSSANRVIEIMARVIDPTRFRWLKENRDPTPIEKEACINATSSLIAAQRVQTFRKNDAKSRQEEAVKQILRAQGFKEIPRRAVTGLATFPQPKEFMGESLVVTHQADVITVLPDKRIVCIECKVSNSVLNSRKRLIHDTCGKAPQWHSKLGSANAIVVAVLTGVFSIDQCEFAQNDRNVFLVWEHRLQDLADFVNSKAP